MPINAPKDSEKRTDPSTIRSEYEARMELKDGVEINPQSSTEIDPQVELISALGGREADRERVLAHRTRRVVLGSLGVMQDQRKDRSRSRAIALAVTLIVLTLIAPLIWEATDSLIAGEHLADPGSQLSLWACILCPTILGAVLIAGWWKNRS